MSKPIIAVDIDDVLAHHAEAIVAYSNKLFGPGHNLENYTEHWSVFWGVNVAETEKRAYEYHLTDDMATYRRHEDAIDVLRELKKKYTLVIVTARRKQVIQITEDWVERHFPGIFDKIYYAGIWDVVTEEAAYATKAELCHSLGVEYLIDDQVKHCNGAVQSGIKAILFGNYPWQDITHLDTRVHRCHNWIEVGEFFGGKSR